MSPKVHRQEDFWDRLNYRVCIPASVCMECESGGFCTCTKCGTTGYVILKFSVALQRDETWCIACHHFIREAD